MNRYPHPRSSSHSLTRSTLSEVSSSAADRATGQRIEFALDSLPRLAAEPGLKFVFVHIIAPHPPFVFGPEGEPVYDKYPFNLLDGDAFPGTRESYARGYIDQLTYINQRLKEVIPALKKASASPPIIILQADHGPGKGLVWNMEYPLLTDEFMFATWDQPSNHSNAAVAKTTWKGLQ